MKTIRLKNISDIKPGILIMTEYGRVTKYFDLVLNVNHHADIIKTIGMKITKSGFGTNFRFFEFNSEYFIKNKNKVYFNK